MKKLIITCLLYGNVAEAQVKDYPIQPVVFTAISYYSWANRGKGEMMVWFPRNVNSKELVAK
jgi:hypothetical protein